MFYPVRLFSLLVLVIMLAVPQGAEAYIGPGVGISAIGTIIALLVAILLAIVGFVWYPFKRLLSWIKKKNNQDSSS